MLLTELKDFSTRSLREKSYDFDQVKENVHLCPTKVSKKEENQNRLLLIVGMPKNAKQSKIAFAKAF